MKKLSFTLLLTLAIVPADAQVERGGGIFGFGRNKEQISAGLFPDARTAPMNASYTAPSEAQQQAAPKPAAMPAPNGENIFRGGSPQQVDSVSYVIEDGQKVEKGAAKKKAGFFSFGKKDKSNAAADTNVIEPIPSQPAPVYPDQNQPAPTSDYTPTAPVVVEEAIADTRSDVSDIPSEAIAGMEQETDKKKSKMFGFFGRKSKAEPADVAQDTPEMSAPAVTAAPEPAPAPAPQVVEAPAPVEAEPASTEPLPSFAGVDPPQKEKSGFNIPNPMKNLKVPSIKAPPNPIKAIRPPKKEKTIDLTGAETIIANGEIVEGQGDIVESNMVETQSSGPRQAPRVVNGVTTYSSWDDVGGRSVSAADKILSQIR